MNEVACPFDEKVPEDVIAYTVPEHLRADIVLLMRRRMELNPFDKDGAAAHNIRWSREFSSTRVAIEKIENELRMLADASRRTHVEYYADWKFRCPDQHTLRAEFIARGGKLTEAAEEKFGIPIYESSPKEVGHLCFAVLTNRKSCPHFPPEKRSATFEEVLALRRTKKKRSAT